MSALQLHPKIKAAGIGFILVTLAGALLQAFGPSLPPGVVAGASALIPVLLGYLTPSTPSV
jgi:hypothetical protein